MHFVQKNDEFSIGFIIAMEINYINYMKYNNIFTINDLHNVVILGARDDIQIISNIVNKLGLNFGLITSPDQESIVKGRLEYDIFSKLDESFIDLINEKYIPKHTLFISLGARWIFKHEVIHKILGGNLVNFHGSRLPFDAGGGGFSWRILKKDRIDNQLVHLVDDGIDTGPILASHSSLFPSECILPKDFERQYKENFSVFFMNFLSDIKKGKKFILRHQMDYIGSYYPRLKTDVNGWINWNWESVRIVDFINAFDDPYSGASTFINNHIVKIKKVQLHGGEMGGHPYMSGLILRKHDEWIVVSTSDCLCLIIEIVESEDGKLFLDKLEVGDRFFTTNDKLLEAQSVRVRFGANGAIVK